MQAIENIHRYKLNDINIQMQRKCTVSLSKATNPWQSVKSKEMVIQCHTRQENPHLMSLYLCIFSIVCVIFQVGCLFLILVSHCIEVRLIFCVDLTFINLVNSFYDTILNSLDFFKTIILSANTTSWLPFLSIFFPFSAFQKPCT